MNACVDQFVGVIAHPNGLWLMVIALVHLVWVINRKR